MIKRRSAQVMSKMNKSDRVVLLIAIVALMIVYRFVGRQ
jgi:hypothetical protein